MHTLQELQVEIRNCRRCLEKGYPISPNPIFSGNANSRVMLIGQAPGIMNETAAFPFNGGRAGKTLFQWLKKAGWEESEFRSKHYIASVTRCYPGKNTKGTGDRVPSLEEQELCGFWREKELDVLKIKLIIPMGKLAISLFIDKKKPLEEIIGNCFQIDNRIIIPIPHPSGASTWLNHPQHKILLENAIEELRNTRNKYSL